MKYTVYPASERGLADFGWLHSHHSFSFGHWYHPAKIHFGALRVLNDDSVKGGMGFGTHPHDNMEIVSIPLQGALAHKDSMGTDGIIQTGDVQIMSAGTGIQHSEFNASPTDPVQFLQIWVIPKQRNITPRYDQRNFEVAARKNNWQVLVSPDASEQALWINQDARFAITDLQAGKDLSFAPRFPGNGVYLFVIEGAVSVEGQTLGKRDAIGISESQEISLQAKVDSTILAIEIPMLTF